MTTDLETLMRATAAGAPPANGLAALARRRAGHLRRRRRAVTAVAAAGSLGAVGLLYRADPAADDQPALATVSAATTPLGVQSAAAPTVTEPSAAAPTVTEPSAAARDCNGAYSSKSRDIAAGDQPARLLSRDPAYQLEWVQSAEMSSDCALAPAALVLVDAGSDGTIRRSLTVWGPRRTPADYSKYVTDPRPTTIRGVAGQLVAVDDTHRTTWTEKAGASWEISASGVTEVELQQVAGALTFSAGAVSLAQPVDGFTAETRTPDVRDTRVTQPEWTVAYKTPSDRIIFSASGHSGHLAEIASQATPGSWKFTTVRGHRALELVKDDQLGVHVQWYEKPGVLVSVYSENGSTDAAGLVAFAETLESAAASDPRIKEKLRRT